MLTERGFAEFLFFHVQDRAQVLADLLTLFDAHGIFRTLDHSTVGPVDDHAEYGPDRLAPQLEIEDFEAVAARHTIGGRPDPLGFHATCRKNVP